MSMLQTFFFVTNTFLAEPNISQCYSLGSWDIVTEHSPQHLRVEGLSLAAATGTKRKTMAKLRHPLEAGLCNKISSLEIVK
jgi:hypothetical protein